MILPVQEKEPIMGDTFRLNEPQVACEVLDGDVILLNFESGRYYNIRGIGADICQHLLAGGHLEMAIQSVAAHFATPLAKVENEIRNFLEDLVQEGLLVPCEAISNDRHIKIIASAYETPHCEKFDDMADQLLLDKIDDQNQDAQWTNG
jgi:hypothetical protein